MNLLQAHTEKEITIIDIESILFNDESIIFLDKDTNKYLYVEKNYDDDLMYRVYNNEKNYCKVDDKMIDRNSFVKDGIIEYDISLERLPAYAIHEILFNAEALDRETILNFYLTPMGYYGFDDEEDKDTDAFTDKELFEYLCEKIEDMFEEE